MPVKTYSLAFAGIMMEGKAYMAFGDGAFKQNGI